MTSIIRLALFVATLLFAAASGAADYYGGGSEQDAGAQGVQPGDSSVATAVSAGFNCGRTQCLCKGFEACLELAKTGLCARKTCVGDMCSCERNPPSD